MCLAAMAGAGAIARCRGRAFLLAAIALWGAGVSTGMGALWAYSNQPGQPGDPPARWPGASSIRPVPGRATLVMAAHPHCPCTRASLGELALIMRHAQQTATCHVLFYRPSGFPEG